MYFIFNSYYLSRVFVFILIIALVCLTSCAQTVHIHSGKLEQSQVLQLQSSLELEGFRYRMRSSKHPSPGMGNLLIYYPQKNSPEQLDKILSILNSLDITVHSLVARKVYKHEYTKSNYGLYIVVDEPEEKKYTSQTDFDFKLTDIEFDSTECGTVLELNPGSSVRLEFISTNDESVEGSSWGTQLKNNKNLLTIRNAHEKYLYEIVSFVTSDNTSKTYTTRLSPLDFYRMPFGCVYEGFFKLTLL